MAQTRGTKTSAKQAAAKRPAAKQATAKTSPVKEALTKTALVNLIADENGVTRDVARGVLATIENAMMGSIHPRWQTPAAQVSMPLQYSASLQSASLLHSPPGGTRACCAAAFPASPQETRSRTSPKKPEAFTGTSMRHVTR